MNDLQNRLESTIITKTFHISGMPMKHWEEVDSFCKDVYGDSRWTMVVDLMRMVKEDYKYLLLSLPYLRN